MKKILFQIAIALLLFFALWYALSRINWIALFKIESVSGKTEKKLGDLFWDVFSESEKEVPDKKITAPTDSLLTRLCEANHIERSEIKLHVIESNDVNAFAFPNKHLVVFTGLLSDAKNEAELTGVMAHELAHIQKNHVMKKLIKEVGLSTLIAVTAGNAGAEIIKRLAKTLSSTAYDRRLESEADLKGVDYLIKANIDPVPFADFLSRLAESEPEERYQLVWISTHPESKERAEKIIDYLGHKEHESVPVLAPATWEKMKDQLKDL